jgi:hypothetical protein
LNEGQLSTHLHDNELVKISGAVRFEVPGDIKNWEEGTTKRIKSKTPVTLHRYHRNSKLDPWGYKDKVEMQIVVDVKKYKGRNLPG